MNYLRDLAETIGWTFVNDDLDFTVYEYTHRISKYEEVSHIARIYEKPNEIMLYDILQTLKKVLPRKLKKKIDKILKNIRIEDLANVVEVVKFAIEEYKAKTEYAKLKEYGELLKVDIEKLGYKFKYTLKKREVQDIMAKIENHLPIELAPVVGRIRRLDYKIAYIKTNKNKLEDKD